MDVRMVVMADMVATVALGEFYPFHCQFRLLSLVEAAPVIPQFTVMIMDGVTGMEREFTVADMFTAGVTTDLSELQ